MALEKAVRSGNSTGFKFEKRGDTLKGYYLGTTEEAVNGRPTKVHRFTNELGTFSVLGQADLYQQLKRNNVSPGTYTEISFTGETMQTGKGKSPMKLYEVAFDRTDIFTGSISDTIEESDYEEEADEEPAYNPPVAPAIAPSTPSAEQRAKIRATLTAARK